VIDTGRNWNDQGGTQESLQPVSDSRNEPRSIANQSSGEPSPSSLRVVSRFFSNCVPSPSPREGVLAPYSPAVEWEDDSDGEPQVSISDDLVDCRCLDVGWDFSPNWEANSSLDNDYGAHLSGTLHVILGVAGLTMVAKFIKRGGVSGTIRRGSKPHTLGRSTPRAIAHSVVYHWGMVMMYCQIWIHPNRFITFRKGGDYSWGCKVSRVCGIIGSYRLTGCLFPLEGSMNRRAPPNQLAWTLPNWHSRILPTS
jgi:hypothetical protein